MAHSSDAVETALPETKHRIQISFMTIWVSARMETVTDRDTPNRRQTRGVDTALLLILYLLFAHVCPCLLIFTHIYPFTLCIVEYISTYYEADTRIWVLGLV